MKNLKNYRYMQYVCVFIGTLLQASLSITSTWVSPVLPQLTSNNTILEAPLTNTEESCFVSAEKLGAIIGCALAGFITDKLGRKRTLLITAVPVFISMMGAAFNKKVIVLIFLRVLFGIGAGLSFVALPLYIAEISEKDIRGKLGVIQVIMATLGHVFAYSLGPFLSIRNFSIICSMFPLLFFILFSFMPETPYYLVKKDKIEFAANSLKRLSKKSLPEDVIRTRLQEVRDFVAMDVKNRIHLKELLTTKMYRRPFLIALAIRCLLALSGVPVIASYLLKIIETSDSIVSPQISSVIFGVIKLPSVLITCFSIDRIGRRPLLIASTVGCAVALLVEGIYFYLKETRDVSNFSWIPTTGLSVYLFSVYFGIDVLPILVVGEIFTVNVKSMASACVACIGFSLGFLLLLSFKPLCDMLGVYTMLWFFSGCCILGCLFAIFLLPETKGKSFAEIQVMLYPDIELKKTNVKHLEPLMR